MSGLTALTRWESETVKASEPVTIDARRARPICFPPLSIPKRVSPNLDPQQILPLTQLALKSQSRFCRQNRCRRLNVLQSAIRQPRRLLPMLVEIQGFLSLLGRRGSRSRRKYGSACQRAGKSSKQIERCVISTFQVAESMGFKQRISQLLTQPSLQGYERGTER